MAHGQMDLSFKQHFLMLIFQKEKPVPRRVLFDDLVDKNVKKSVFWRRRGCARCYTQRHLQQRKGKLVPKRLANKADFVKETRFRGVAPARIRVLWPRHNNVVGHAVADNKGGIVVFPLLRLHGAQLPVSWQSA